MNEHKAMRALWALGALALAGCSGTPDPAAEDGGVELEDLCNSRQEALEDPGCELLLGQPKEAFLSFADDRDWYSFRTPAGANARTLLHLHGGYQVPNTAVNLSLNLLREDGEESLARRSDRHGQGPPRPVEIILPFSEPNARLVVLVSDDPLNPSRPQFDARAPYRLTVNVLQDPDENEPNDLVPTAIPLTPQGGILRGEQRGHLATAGDVDRFSVQVPGGKKVLYLALRAPALSPPPPFRLAYQLYAPDGTPVAEGSVQNEFLPVELATARLSRTAGTWELRVHGQGAPGTTGPVPGDLRLQYEVEFRVMDEDDPSEGPGQNDTLQTARPVSFSAPGTTRTERGRIGYVPDTDWYRVELPAHSAPTVLYYRLVPGIGPARFPPLPGVPDRELRVLRQVQTGGSAQDNVVACKTNPAICPKGYGNDSYLAGLVAEQCEVSTGPRCLWSLRHEHAAFAALRNFEGTLHIPPRASAAEVFLLVQHRGNDWADDLDYTLELQWRADPDEASRYQGGVEGPVVRTLAHDLNAQSFPLPPPGAASELTGRLSYGHGYLRSHNPNLGQGVRAPLDYDAVSSDADRYELLLPDLDPDAGHLDRTWELQWEIEHASGSPVRPYDLAVELTFCDGDQGQPGTCFPVTKGSKGRTMVMQYTSAKVSGWHNVDAPAELRQAVYQRIEQSTRTTVSVLPYGCFCFEPRFIRGGKFYLKVIGIDRKSYADLPYVLRTAYTDYPQSYPLVGGGSQSCPPPVEGADGGTGCWFTREP